MKKLLYVIDRSCNQKALSLILNRINEMYDIQCDSINLHQYKNQGSDLQKNYDILIYQTFPHQNHKQKWDAGTIDITDNLFNQFDGLNIFQEPLSNKNFVFSVPVDAEAVQITVSPSLNDFRFGTNVIVPTLVYETFPFTCLSKDFSFFRYSISSSCSDKTLAFWMVDSEFFCVVPSIIHIYMSFVASSSFGKS